MTQPNRPEPVDLPERLSTLIDGAAILAVGAGIGWGLFSVLGPYAVAIGGLIAIVLNFAAGWLRSRPEPVIEPEPVEAPAPPPGPEHPGNTHVSGR
jgi:hypothetical protein